MDAGTRSRLIAFILCHHLPGWGEVMSSLGMMGMSHLVLDYEGGDVVPSIGGLVGDDDRTTLAHRLSNGGTTVDDRTTVPYSQPTQPMCSEVTTEPCSQPTQPMCSEVTTEPCSQPTQSMCSEVTTEPCSQPTQSMCSEVTTEACSQPTQSMCSEVTTEPCSQPTQHMCSEVTTEPYSQSSWSGPCLVATSDEVPLRSEKHK
jgi:hypothetical protein